MSLVAHFADAPLMKMKGYKVRLQRDPRGRVMQRARLLLGVHLPNTEEMSVYETKVFAMKNYTKRAVVAEPRLAEPADYEKRQTEKLATYKEFAAAKKKAQKDKMEGMKLNLANIYTPDESQIAE
mmetsp:Transcript_70663/g.132247  ORF Transcript_70663/g.132247 Transcript_70663/m.132247 type:complete len:125 (+) Transcript_70663:3-377(+)